jgi:LAO/AO transport system kinase
VRTQATTGQGVGDVIDTIARFQAHPVGIDRRRRDRAAAQLRAILASRLMRQIDSRVSNLEMHTLVDRISARAIDPYSAADQLLRGMEPHIDNS